MARIKINDLENNVNLNEEDVQRIVGGAFLRNIQFTTRPASSIEKKDNDTKSSTILKI